MSEISVKWDNNGSLQKIADLQDEYKMNWISPIYKTGDIKGFSYSHCDKNQNGCKVFLKGLNDLYLTVNKYLKDNVYTEEYLFENKGVNTAVIDKDNGALSFAGNSFFDKKSNMLQKRCNTHVFVGEDKTYLYSVKLCGTAPYLYTDVKEGCFVGYSLSSDTAVTDNASYDRGQIWILPKRTVLKPDETLKWIINYSFIDHRPESEGFFCNADKYSLLPDDVANITVKDVCDIKELTVKCGEQEIPMVTNGNTATGVFAPKTCGQYKIDITVNGKKTYIAIQKLPYVSEILSNRADFICRNQQCLDKKSRYYGAYLIYDNDTGELVCEEEYTDRNSARERLAMGVTVALALQKSKCEKWQRSIMLYREFLEKEIIDTENGTVKNSVDDDTVRLYNYPWAATFYFEYYRAFGDTSALKTAAAVMVKYYGLGGENMEAHVEIHRMLPYLQAEGYTNLYNKVFNGYLKHADSVCRRRTASSSSEVSCANGMMSIMGIVVINAFLLTGNEKYKAPAEDIKNIVNGFFAFQPDFHCYGMSVRYWDLYWFGKCRTYGDTFPQWLSANSAEFLTFYDKIANTDSYNTIREILLGGLCVYGADGSASCGYLYPDEVNVYSSDGKPQKYRPIGIHRGKFYDSFANDQDWTLYYAVTLLKDCDKK